MAEKALRLTDADFLRIVADEKAASIGLDLDDELNGQREKALEYFKGQMDDVPSLPNRSKAVSTDIADAVETVLPDLIEIFTGGEDVAAFSPVGEEDVEAAEQETDYINHVVFQQNPGFLNFYTAFKDALTVKTGIFKFWWEEYEEEEEQRFEDVGEIEYQLVADNPDVEITDFEQSFAGGEGQVLPGLPGDPGEMRYSFTVRRVQTKGCAKFQAVPPEDFTVAADTVWLPNTTYCAMRSRVRAQDLIADGYDPQLVKSLPSHDTVADEEVDEARDTADESDNERGQSADELRIVEIVEHYVRVDADGDGKPEIWRVVTGGGETILLEKEKKDAIEFAALTPYITPHRFYGRSLADLLMDIQRIKTALLRMMLDSGYFAMNQRLEVAEDRSNANTIADLLRNEPGVPIRTKTGDAIRPISAGALNFDVTGALEYASTMAEQRTGIVRNAQGLNPDTLHDTAKGAQALMTAAQRRVRLIARIFAETGVKDLFVGLHRLIRTHATAQDIVRLRGRFVPVDPTRWGIRKDMVIEVGLGSGGKEMEVALMQSIIGMQTKAVEVQGGVQGPLVTAENIYNAVKRYAERAGIKAPEMFFTDPKDAPQQESQPDPEIIKAQQDAQIEQAKLQQEGQIKREQMQMEDRLAREKMAGEFQLAREKMQMEAQMGVIKESMRPDPRIGGGFRPGGSLSE